MQPVERVYGFASAPAREWCDPLATLILREQVKDYTARSGGCPSGAERGVRYNKGLQTLAETPLMLL